jgi:hypothetical protein
LNATDLGSFLEGFQCQLGLKLIDETIAILALAAELTRNIMKVPHMPSFRYLGMSPNFIRWPETQLMILLAPSKLGPIYNVRMVKFIQRLPWSIASKRRRSKVDKIWRSFKLSYHQLVPRIAGIDTSHVTVSVDFNETILQDVDAQKEI